MLLLQVGTTAAAPNSVKQKPKSDKWQLARRNTIKTLAIVAFCYVFCWSWNQIYYMMINLGFPADFASNFFHFTVIILFTNAVINPFIYTFQYSDFKKAATKLFCSRLIRNSSSGESSVNTSQTNQPN